MSRIEMLPFVHHRALPVLFAVALAAVSLATPAAASTPAEAYVQENVEKGLSILNNHSIPDSQRRAEFRDFLTSLTDIKRIALFTLGPARRTATPAELDAFVDAFRNYAVAVYESRLNQYAGQSLRVTGSTERSPGDYIVDTIMVDPNGRTSGQEPIQVDFRVESENGKFVVIDASIVGVWLALEERDQFTAFLQQTNDNIGALITHLQSVTEQLRNGGRQETGSR